jgi:uncharacterized membrane protein YhhN
MLNYLRERRDALNATHGRRNYNRISAASLLAFGVLAATLRTPIWVGWAALALSLLVDNLLIRKWIREDALRAYQADQPA